MRKYVSALWGVLKRVGEANLSLGHYWFLPKPAVIPLTEKEDLDIRENSQLLREELRKGSLPRFVTNYKLRQAKK